MLGVPPPAGANCTTAEDVRSAPRTPVTEYVYPAYGALLYVLFGAVTVTVGVALVIVMLAEPVLPSWFWSPPKVYDAVQPSVTVTFVQSPL